MSIDDAQLQLSMQKKKFYVLSKEYEALQLAIDTMRKYQKIEQIVKEWGDSGLLQNQLYKLIREVVEDGQNNN